MNHQYASDHAKVTFEVVKRDGNPDHLIMLVEGKKLPIITQDIRQQTKGYPTVLVEILLPNGVVIE